MVVTASVARHVEVRGHGRRACVSAHHPTSLRECDRLLRSDDPVAGSLAPDVRVGHRRKCDPEYFHDPARARELFAQLTHPQPLRAGLDCQNRHEARASRRANACIRKGEDHSAVQVGYYRNRDAGNRCRADSVANADPAGSNSAGTSKCYCQTRSRRQTRRGRAATSFVDGRTGCAGTKPSSRCNKPSDRSDTAPSPTTRNQPTSSRTAGTRSNARSDTAPNRCRS